MRYRQEGDRLVIKEGQRALPLSIWIGVLSTFFLLFMVFALITGAIPQPRTLGELFKFLIYLIASIGLMIFSVCTFIRSTGYQIVIDSEGVREERRFLKNRCRELCWKEIADWGCTYSPVNYYRSHKRHYWFYFSDVVLPEDLLSKKVDKECIWVDALGEKELEELYPVIMQFCKQKTKVFPYRSVSVKKLMGEYITKKKR